MTLYLFHVFSGGLFGDEEDPTIEAAFRYAIHRINQDRNILPRTKIGFDIQHLPAHNSFLASKRGEYPFSVSPWLSETFHE